MSTAKEYLDFLFQQNPEFFSQPPEPSTLTEEDLHWMEQQLGYSLPAQFQAFNLLSTGRNHSISHILWRIGWKLLLYIFKRKTWVSAQ